MKTPLRVLLVEDSEDDALLLVRHLVGAGYGVVHERVDTPETMAAAVDRAPWDVVLSDNSMPHFSGVDALRLVAERGLDTPFIVVSGTIGEEAAVELMKAGAHDFVRKDHLARLIPAIQRELREAETRRRRREAETALHESEDRFRVMADTAPVMIWVSAPDGLRTFFNKPWLDFRGRTMDEEAGTGWMEGVHPEDHARCTEAYSAAFQARRSLQIEFRLRRRDGEYRWVLDIAAPRFDDSGAFAGYIGSCIDIHDRRRAEEALVAAQQRLIEVERDKKRFYCEVIRVVTNDKLHLVDAPEIPLEGRKVLDLSLADRSGYTELRERVRQAAQEAGMKAEHADDLVLAVSEAALNAVKHAVRGRCFLYVSGERVIARVSDQGHGIQPENLPASILMPGFSTRVSLGMGYTIMLRLMDRIWLATGSEGTTVQLEKWIHPEEHEPEPLPAAWGQL